MAVKVWEKSLRVAAWNCRGLSESVPYIESLLLDDLGVLVLSEHWLWPFELERLNEVNDMMLLGGPTESSGGGCGGIGILWNNYWGH